MTTWRQGEDNADPTTRRCTRDRDSGLGLGTGRDSDSGTRDSGLGIRDSGLGIRDSGLPRRSSGVSPGSEGRNTYAPGATVCGRAGSPSGRFITESFDVNAAQPCAGAGSRRADSGGYTAGINGSSQPPSYAPSPTTGTTSTSRARVAATYVSRCASALSRAASSPSWRRRSTGAHPPSFNAHRLRAESSQRPASVRDSLHVASARITTGNSRPFALWTVIIRTPSLPSSRIGASAAWAVSAAARSSSTKPRNEMPPPRLVLPCQFCDVQHVRERLFARRSQHEADVRARRVQQLVNGLGNRHVVAAAVQRLQQTAARRRSVRDATDRRRGIRNGWKHQSRPRGRLLPLEQLLVTNREQRSAQRRKHRQLVVRPLDRRERGADRFDFLAIVKCLAADEHMMDAARFERLARTAASCLRRS